MFNRYFSISAYSMYVFFPLRRHYPMKIQAKDNRQNAFKLIRIFQFCSQCVNSLVLVNDYKLSLQASEVTDWASTPRICRLNVGPPSGASDQRLKYVCQSLKFNTGSFRATSWSTYTAHQPVRRSCVNTDVSATLGEWWVLNRFKNEWLNHEGVP